MEAYDIEALAKDVNTLKPTFFWCGLGAPKQERLMSLLQPHLKQTISLGEGLAFEYYAGTVKRAPKWMQKSGLEWVYRDIQQPIKLIKFKLIICKIQYCLLLKLKSKGFLIVATFI